MGGERESEKGGERGKELKVKINGRESMGGIGAKVIRGTWWDKAEWPDEGSSGEKGGGSRVEERVNLREVRLTK